MSTKNISSEEKSESQSPQATNERDFAKTIRKKTLIAFGIFFLLNAVGVSIWFWIRNSEMENGQYKPLRAALNANEKINNAFFRDENLVKEYSKEQATKKVRSNGYYGGSGSHDTSVWRLRIIHNNTKDPADSVLILTLNDLLQLKKHEEVFNFKCVEGWSQITWWGGCTFADFLIKYKLGTHSGNAPDKNNPDDLYKYVSLETPDGKYYVGIDMKSMLHPQTLLCYELNGAALPDKEGHPLRLIIPLKYGIKNLKWIGTISFSDERPRDYWFERGYDYDAAL